MHFREVHLTRLVPLLTVISPSAVATNLGQVTITAKGLNGIQGTATLTVIGLPSRFAPPSGGGQTGTVNTTLPTPFQVVLQTSNGTPVPGA